VRRTSVVLVWFHITLTTFRARITTIHLYLLYLKHYWFHFSRTRCINKYTQAYTSSNTEKAMLTQEVNTKVTIKYENIKRLLLIWFMQRLFKCACTLISKKCINSSILSAITSWETATLPCWWALLRYPAVSRLSSCIAVLSTAKHQRSNHQIINNNLYASQMHSIVILPPKLGLLYITQYLYISS